MPLLYQNVSGSIIFNRLEGIMKLSHLPFVINRERFEIIRDFIGSVALGDRRHPELGLHISVRGLSGCLKELSDLGLSDFQGQELCTWLHALGIEVEDHGLCFAHHWSLDN